MVDDEEIPAGASERPDALAAALADHFTPGQLAELRDGVLQIGGILGRGSDHLGAWSILAAAVEQVAPPKVGRRVVLVDDRGVTGPYVLYPNAQREGDPVQVFRPGTEEVILVVPAGESFQVIPGGSSDLAQRLYVTAPTPAQLAAAGF